MKFRIILLIFGFLSFSCDSDKDTDRLIDYLNTFNCKIFKYKVVCFVPVDAYSKFINPSLNYAREARADFLLVMTSRFKKSIDYTEERLQFPNKNHINDYNNLAQEKGLANDYSPVFYFLRYGRVIKKVDLAAANNKNDILEDVEWFFAKEDELFIEMEKSIESGKKHSKSARK